MVDGGCFTKKGMSRISWNIHEICRTGYPALFSAPPKRQSSRLIREIAVLLVCLRVSFCCNFFPRPLAISHSHTSFPPFLCAQSRRIILNFIFSINAPTFFFFLRSCELFFFSYHIYNVPVTTFYKSFFHIKFFSNSLYYVRSTFFRNFASIENP